MLEPPKSLKSVYYIINRMVKSLRLVNQQETIFIIIVYFCLQKKNKQKREKKTDYVALYKKNRIFRDYTQNNF